MKPLSKKKLMHIPTIDMGDLLLRPVEPEDFKDMYDYGKDPEVTKYLTWDAYESIDEAVLTIKRVFLKRPEFSLPYAYAIYHKKNKKMIGTCDFFQIDWEHKSGEIGYVLHKDYWNRGYMSRVLKEVIGFGIDYLGLVKVEIRHLPGNDASKKVIEKNGFRFIGNTYYEPTKGWIPTYELTKKEYLVHRKKS
jgi:ribosomal-protein-alanine N-acetyltransferase